MQVQIYYSSRQLQLPRLLRRPSSPSPTRTPSLLRPPLGLQCPSPPLLSGPARDSSFAAVPTLLQEQVLCTDSDSEDEEDEGPDGAGGDDTAGPSPSEHGLLVVRRPVKGLSGEEAEARNRGEDGWVEEEEASASRIDAGLNEFAKMMPMFEPLERVGAGWEERPLGVNLELWLYRAKVLTREFQYGEAEKILRKVLHSSPTFSSL